jgi:hypothetical protein
MIKALLISVWLVMHPVHVSLTSIDFVPDTGNYNVFVRMYFDDFMTDSKLNGNVVNSADFYAGTSASQDAVMMYLNKKLIIKVNEKPVSGKLGEMKVADNEISMNLEFKGGKKPVIIIVKNLILTDLYADQSNMLIVKVNDFEEGVKLTSDITEQTFKIK